MTYNPEILEEIIKAQDVFVWEAPSWEARDRGPRWYLVMTLIAVGFFLYAVISGNFLFAFLVIFAALILVLSGHEQPPTVLVQIGKNGVVVDGTLYEFKDLANFSIVYNPPETKVLYIEHRSALRPRLRLEIMDQNPISLRDHLRLYVEENLDLQDEHVSDILARLLKI